VYETQEDVATPEPPVEAATPEAMPEPPVVDLAAHAQLTAEHAAAVTSAHQTLSQRMDNAYSIFSADLDRAYRIWEDGVKLVREGSSLIHSGGTNVNPQDADPATAR
jgi:hypothetical protein